MRGLESVRALRWGGVILVWITFGSGKLFPGLVDHLLPYRTLQGIFVPWNGLHLSG